MGDEQHLLPLGQGRQSPPVSIGVGPADTPVDFVKDYRQASGCAGPADLDLEKGKYFRSLQPNVCKISGAIWSRDALSAFRCGS